MFRILIVLWTTATLQIFLRRIYVRFRKKQGYYLRESVSSNLVWRQRWTNFVCSPPSYLLTPIDSRFCEYFGPGLRQCVARSNPGFHSWWSRAQARHESFNSMTRIFPDRRMDRSSWKCVHSLKIMLWVRMAGAVRVMWKHRKRRNRFFMLMKNRRFAYKSRVAVELRRSCFLFFACNYSAMRLRRANFGARRPLDVLRRPKHSETTSLPAERFCHHKKPGRLAWTEDMLCWRRLVALAVQIWDAWLISCF